MIAREDEFITCSLLLYKMKAGDTAATTTPCSVIGSDIAIAGSAHPPNNIIEDAHNIMIKHREWRVIPKTIPTPATLRITNNDV